MAYEQRLSSDAEHLANCGPDRRLWLRPIQSSAAPYCSQASCASNARSRLRSTAAIHIANNPYEHALPLTGAVPISSWLCKTLSPSRTKGTSRGRGSCQFAPLDESLLGCGSNSGSPSPGPIQPAAGNVGGPRASSRWHSSTIIRMNTRSCNWWKASMSFGSTAQ